MPVLDNPKEEKFAQLVFDGYTQRGAYRAAFPISRKWKDTTVDPKASNLYWTDKVQARLNELKTQAKAKYEQDAMERVLSVVDRMVILTRIAQDSESDKARISAVDTLNKMDGVYVNKVEVASRQKDMDRMDDILKELGMLDE